MTTREPGRTRDSPDVDALLDELRVHQGELEVQNEELRYTQLALERSRDRYFQLFDRAPVAYLILSSEAVVLEANQFAADLLGQRRELLRGASFLSFLELEALETGRRLVQAAIRRREGRATAEVQLRAAGPVDRYAQVELTSMTDDSGDRVVLATLLDVTDRVAAQAERERLAERLRHAQKMEAVGTLAGGVAHDMNNVLGAIVAISSAAIADGARDGVREDLARILESAERGAELTRNLLGFARKGKFRREPIAVEGLLAAVADVLTRTVSRQVRIATRCAPHLPPVSGDASQLNHALMNLCLNGVDAMDGAGVLTLEADALEVEAEDTRAGPEPLKPGTYVALRVRDTGRGMDRETRERAFEPFFTTKSPGDGTGLGLSMVYGTVHAHEGGIRIVSRPGEGTAVELWLPAARPGARSRRPSGAAIGAVAVERSLGVLVVDDEPHVRRATGRLLGTLGHRVLSADSGQEALSVYGRDPDAIDVVLLDMVMPGLDGEATLDALLERHRDARVLICSGYSRNERVEAALTRGAVGFLQKPFDRNALAAALAAATQPDPPDAPAPG